MGNSIGLLLLLQVVLIALNAVFASAEIAVLSINETKLERTVEEGDIRAKRLFRLTQEPAKFLATIQVAITLSGFLGSAFAADNFFRAPGRMAGGTGRKNSPFYAVYHCGNPDYDYSVLFYTCFRRTGSEADCNEKV